MFIWLRWRFWLWKFWNAMIAFRCSCLSSLFHLLSSNVILFESIFFSSQKNQSEGAYLHFNYTSLAHGRHEHLFPDQLFFRIHGLCHQIGLRGLFHQICLYLNHHGHHYCHNFRDPCVWFYFWILSQALWISAQQSSCNFHSFCFIMQWNSDI